MTAVRRALLVKKCLVEINNIFVPCARKLSDNCNNNNILRSAYGDVDIPQMTLPEYIYSKIENFGGFTAIECAITGKRYSFEKCRLNCRNFSKSLIKKLKLKKGDVVAILLPNNPDYLIAAMGILEAGLVLTTLNPLYTPDEISRHLLDSSTRAIITNAAICQNAKAAIQLIQKQIPVICVKTTESESLPDGSINFEELIESNSDIPDFQPGNCEELACLPYSSGTTGLPKGVELTHRNLVSNLCQILHPQYNYLSRPTDTFQDVTPGILPLFHIYGFTVTLLYTLTQGTKMITLNRFTPDLYISVLKKHKISVVYAAPPLVLFLTVHPEVKPEYFKYLKTITSGAAPLGQLDEDRFQEKFGKHIRVNQGYGMTETSPIITYSPSDVNKVGGSIGRAIPNTMIKVINPEDPAGVPLGPKQSGELLVKGPQVMKGYHNKPQETEKVFLDGWLRTGDIVHYDENEMLFVSDRLKELIKVKGYQVAPAELEEIIRDFPSVQDAAVIGIPHPVHGEVPRAYIVSNNQEINLDELQKYVSKKVAKYKQLAGGVKVITQIPKNASGKILRRQLKLAYEQQGI